MQIINTQAAESSTKTAPVFTIEIVKVWETLQGEGPFSGIAATFIRTAGCNLQCAFCDTDYTSKRRHVDIGALVAEVNAHDNRLVVITGGEPFRQENLGLLVDEILNKCPKVDAVQIETNGTLFKPGPWQNPRVAIVCSPKSPSLNERLVPYIKCWKYVLADKMIDPKDGLPTAHLGSMRPARPVDNTARWDIYVQPLDCQDADMNLYHLEAAKQVALKFGYRLGVQLHKLVGLE